MPTERHTTCCFPVSAGLQKQDTLSVKDRGGETGASDCCAGQSLVEYALIIAFVALLAVVSLLMFRPVIGTVLSSLSLSV